MSADPFRWLFWGPSPVFRGWPATSTAQMDWLETPAAYIYKFDVPGFNKDEVKVQVEDSGVLYIGGGTAGDDHGDDNKNKGATWHVAERKGKREFSRRVQLPEDVKADQIRAAVENGVLTVVVPKEPPPARVKPRVVSVASKL